MVFKGFTDENGNVIPVQGAGTVYNEQKNSLALGKDTSAIGQDQFVFGRRNIEDADKVEIVGGGTAGEAYEITDINEMLSYLTALTIGLPVTIANDPFLNALKSVTVFKLGSNLSEAISFANSYYGDSVSVVIGADSGYTDNDFIAVFSRDFKNYSNAKSLFNGAVVLLGNDGKIYRSLNTTAAGNSVTYHSLYSFDLVRVLPIITHANIRTLDWEGNEKLAGSLTVGKGITIGETSLSQAELIALKALLNS